MVFNSHAELVSVSIERDSETSSEWLKSNSCAKFISASIWNEIPKQVRKDSKVTVKLNLFQHLFEKDSETSSEWLKSNSCAEFILASI